MTRSDVLEKRTYRQRLPGLAVMFVVSSLLAHAAAIDPPIGDPVSGNLAIVMGVSIGLVNTGAIEVIHRYEPFKH